MNDEAQKLQPDFLKTLIPMDSLSQESLSEIAEEFEVRQYPSGKEIFHEGDQDKNVFFLLEGKIGLASAKEKKTVDAGTEQSKYALSNFKPRRYTATAGSDASVAVLDAELMETYLAWDQMSRPPTDGYQVVEMEGIADVEWAVNVLKTKVFLNLPTANIEKVMGKFERQSITQGTQVIKQGEAGDYYYIIRSGSFGVTRTSDGGGELNLAEIGEGEAFGEEALISDSPRNATVTALTDGEVMRLAKQDFLELLEEPMLNWISDKDAISMTREGAILLDTRLESEFKAGSVTGARNLPLYMLRLKAPYLDPQKKYIVFCDTGARSAAAAFLLGQNGIKTFVVTGGLAKYMSQA